MGHKPLYRQIADRFVSKLRVGSLNLAMRYLPNLITNRVWRQPGYGASGFAPAIEQQILESIQGSGTYVKEERSITIFFS